MIQPIKNNILFKPFKTDSVTLGGLIVPDSSINDSDKGVIIAVGNGTNIKPMRLKVGQIAYRVHQWGEQLIENGENYYLMEDSAIIALN